MSDNTRPKTVTRADVARAAGTSATTVSYVINDGPKAVAPGTRQRVLDAIDELGYRPNLIARSLRAAHTETIGMLVPQIQNPFFAGLVAAIEEEAIARKKMVLFGTTGYRGEAEEHYLSSFDDRMVDAILVIGPTKELRSATSQRQGALLVLDRTGRRNVVSIGINHQESAAAATTHLIEHGYGSIACITGPSTRLVSATRVRGWRDAIRKHGLVEDPDLLRRTSHSLEGGYEATLDLFGSPGRPRAAFVSSDIQTIGALRALADLGLSVPDDVALFSFDGTQIGNYLLPRVSSVQQPIDAIARAAMEVIQEQPRRSRTIQVPFELVLRASCGCDDDHYHQPGAE
jgi:LacI family transcriptional regulator